MQRGDDGSFAGDVDCQNLQVRSSLLVAGAPIVPFAGVTHDATLTGDGAMTPLSVVDPFLGASHDATLTGDGKTVPLSVVDPYLGVFRDGSLSGDGKATPLSVVSAPTGSTGIAHDATLSGDGKTGTPLSVLSAPTGSTGIAHDATLSGDGKTGTPLSVLSAPTGSTGIAHDATLTGDGKTGTPLSVVATAFASATSARALNSTFAPSATKYTLVLYSVQVALTAGQDGTCELRSDAASPPVTVISSMRGACSGLIGDTNTMRSVLVHVVPPGHNVRLVTSGTGTFAISNQTEITITG